MATSDGYSSDDLVYIHDDGFHSYAMDAAPALLSILKERGIHKGLVVDLGSGTGRWVKELSDAGYECRGIDQSLAMVKFAEAVAPQVMFRVASIFDAPLPPCNAITSMGECLNYRFGGARSSKAALLKLFRRVYEALQPGGVFVFDIATPDRAPKGKPRVHRRDGKDWAIVSVTTKIPSGLRRSMVFFRRYGEFFRRGEETHDLSLYPVADILTALRRCGFRARRLPAKGYFQEVPGMAWFLAEKR
ncbi:MAG: class I SAM-dependent methyltransferase [Bryobacteraceae bacterium]